SILITVKSPFSGLGPERAKPQTSTGKRMQPVPERAPSTSQKTSFWLTPECTSAAHTVKQVRDLQLKLFAVCHMSATLSGQPVLFRHRPDKQQRVDARVLPLHPPMEMRARGAARGADRTQHLAAPDVIADPHVDAGEV